MYSSSSSFRASARLGAALVTAALTACGGGGSADPTSTVQAATSTVAVAATASSAPSSSVDTTTSTSNDLPGSTASSTSTSGTTTGSTTTGSTTGSTTTSSSGTSDTSTTGADSDATSSASTTTGSSSSTDTSVATTATDPGTSTNASTSTSASSGTAAAAAPTVPRPAYNTGTGFYVVGSKLYDTGGNEFRIRGVNRVHWDQGASATGIPRSGANTERIAFDFTQAATSNVALANAQMVAKQVVPMPGNWTATCKTDAASIEAIVDTWVAQAPTWTTIDRYSIINIANEWGPSNSTVWRDEYITAIARLRAAGYKGTLSITSGGCGQDQADLINYAQSVFDSDPEKNVIFDLHVYGHFYATQTASWQTLLAPSLASIAALNLPVVIGEFGPGNGIGPSPTTITPQTIVADAEQYGFGWLVWAWDDNDLANCASDDHWFSMTRSCGTYNTSSDLTAFGQLMVPILQSLARPAQNFD